MRANPTRSSPTLADLRLDLLLKLGNHQEHPVTYLREVVATPDAPALQKAVAHYFLHQRSPERADKIRHLREVQRLLEPSDAKAKILMELTELDDEVQGNCMAVIAMPGVLPPTQAQAHLRLAALTDDRDEKVRHCRIARTLHEDAPRKADAMLRLIALGDEVRANARAILAMQGHANIRLNAEPAQIEQARAALDRAGGRGGDRDDGPNARRDDRRDSRRDDGDDGCDPVI